MKHRLERFTLGFSATAMVSGLLLSMTAVPTRGAFDVERVVGGLNQPIHMAQAPGDSGSIYIVERADSPTQLGRIRKFDLQSQSFTTFLDLPGTINGDGGLLSLTFHPQFQTNGLFYVVTNDAGNNRLDEYRVAGGAPQFQRRLLQYQNLANVFHTLNQVHFRPNGNNNELFVTAGDGGTQANDQRFDIELIEDPNSPYGKLMRINLAASFPTPANGPSHPGVDVIALGLRNPYRSSFDRQTGDFYLGDVGFDLAEEIDFIPASHFTNPSAPILDFGWTDREGTAETDASQAGGPGSPGDINPIFDYLHGPRNPNPLSHPSAFFGQSITAGYLYRGPAPELQGRYFFSDFVNGNVYSGTFNTSTPAASFNGTNLTNIQNHTADFESRVAGGANIQFVTSFAEDNAGNLYIVKFGDEFFPDLGLGEIFRIVPGTSIVRGDLNFDSEIDAEDYSLFLAGNYTDLSGLDLDTAYQRGDLDRDLDNDFNDFRIFKQEYIAAKGAQAWADLAARVPEPTGLVLTAIVIAAVATIPRRTIRTSRNSDVSFVILCCGPAPAPV
jgi:hypothetical protein